MFDFSSLNGVDCGIDTARGLPNELYSRDELFELEKRKVLFPNWAALTVGSNVPNNGDAMPIEFAGVPLLVVRDRDGSVKVFENVCRHRGMILVSEKTTISGAIRCPYHSWCYGLDGRLVSTPHVGGAGHNTHPGIKRSELGLNEVRSYVWHDIVFINISGDAPEFTDYAAKLIERWGEYEHPMYHGGPESSFKFDVAANWKLAVENFAEGYHLPWIHPGLNSFSRLEDHYNIEEPGVFSGQGSTACLPPMGANGQRFPDFPNLSSMWDTGAEYVSFYPNVLLGVHRDHTYAIILQPLARGHTMEHVEVYYATEEARDKAWETMRAKNAEILHTIFQEDVFVVEGMQKGREAVQFDGGKFSPVMDGPTHCFHTWVADQLAR